MTLTTVGYYITPATFGGKLVFGLCATSGIFLIYLPIPIVVTSFASCYRDRLWRSEISIKKRLLNQKKKAEEMFENKKKFFNFAQIGVHISNSIQNLVDRESLETNNTVSLLQQLDYEEIHEGDSCIFNVEN